MDDRYQDDLPDQLFRKFCELLNSQTGILLKDYKKYLIVNRLSKMVGEGREYPDFESYYRALSADRSGSLMTGFINALTTNYSYFFRDPIHFRALADYLDEAADREPSLRLWSAASSTGEEAYSMAITVLKGKASKHPDLRILATDISTRVLEEAEEGIFPADHVLKEMSPEDLGRWFRPVDGGARYRVSDQVKHMIAFRYLNLLSPFPFKKQMDIVFLRNVLIYFGAQEKEIVLGKVWECLKPGGILMVGLSESLVGSAHKFRMEKNSIYRKE